MSDVTVEVIGAGRAADRFGRIRTNLRELERTAPQEVAVAAVPAYKAMAPDRSGNLKRAIHADQGEVISDVRSKQGYSYTGVTRKGHKLGTGPDPDRIYPRADRAPASIIATRRPRATGGKAALAFSIGGRLIFRRSVKRYHPARDWADAGYFTAQRIIRRRFGELVGKALS